MKIRELFGESAADSFRQALQNKKTPVQTKPKLNSFKQGIKSGFKAAQDFQADLPYSTLGKAARGIGRFVQQVQKGPKR